MAYYNEDQLYRYFDKAINNEANKKMSALRKEIDYLYAKEMKKIKDNLMVKKNLQLNKELRELQIEYQDQINKIGVGFDEKLIKERTFMINMVFQSVLLELGDFIQTTNYDDLMEKKISEISKFVKQKKVVFNISEIDQRITKVIEKTMKTPYEIKVSYDIRIGGFIVEIPSDKVEIDETLDSKLKERKEWFFKNSKLFIRT
ncbi:MAG: V-type ATP synthase subunit E [Acholeplasmataceae bacterium]|nr:V-type ATP synthase subunit E [Acholeplasmataceae bacterium]